MADKDELTQRQQDGRTITAASAQLYRRTSSYVIRSLDDVDLSKGKHAVLRILSEQDGLSLARIADKGALDRGNVTRIVASLEKGGYLKREVDPTARHGYQIFLTDMGKAAVRRMQRIADEWCDRLLEGMDDEEVSRLARALSKLADRAEQIANER